MTLRAFALPVLARTGLAAARSSHALADPVATVLVRSPLHFLPRRFP